LDLKFKLNILWLENKLGISIDQIQSGKRIPLTNYFFWPESDAWEQIRNELNSKPWILNEEKAELLNTTAVTMNKWQDFFKKQILTEK